ncbi:YcaO-like family protein [Pseudomonas sp. SORT22]|uniref:YcaO-like family protein n=1 Tax=Pseudomonas sp. SORT22 TaxID=2813842 RepID=UPI001BCC6B73|nr:YcaO-like family protein [Pseudomonas sp. SORT22]QVM97077.1 YcaO-like family protein [Pseudomonas sp. SORT22]
MKTIAPERTLSLDDAESAIDQHFSSEGIHLTLRRYGSPLSSTVATLHLPYDSSGIECVGCGKGYEAEARVGAKFEAYEHYMGPFQLRKHSALHCFDSVVSQPSLQNILPMQMLRHAGASQMAVLSFEAHEASAGVELLYPSFLINHQYANESLPGDDTDYSAARRYSCGTGVAAGVGFTEAAIHAASEVIERHGIGRFIAQHFFYDSKEPIRKIIDNSMPEHLLNTLRDAETAIGASIEVFDASSQIDYPVFIAYCPKKTIADIHVVGGGCSLYPSHAAARAIKELVQQYKVAEGVQHVTQEWTNSKNNLGKNPKLLRCLRMAFGATQRAKTVPYPMPQDPEKMPLALHLSHLKNECFKANHPLWLKELHSSPNQVSLACAVMPKMERFSIVSLGGKVVPCYQYE